LILQAVCSRDKTGVARRDHVEDRVIFRFFTGAACALLMATSATFQLATVDVAQAQAAGDTFVGTVDGSDAFVGIVSDGVSVIAYVCDGASNTLGNDFRGSFNDASGGMLTLHADNGTQLMINADASSMPDMLASGQGPSGTVTTADGNTMTFSTGPAVPPAGVFLPSDGEMLPNGAPVDGGWVVLNNGDVRGVGPFAGSNGGFGKFGHSASLPSLASSGRRSPIPVLTTAQTATLLMTTTQQTTQTTVALGAVTTTQTNTLTQNLTQTFVAGGGQVGFFPATSGSTRMGRIRFP
jgi:hypothetical protein